MSGTPKIAIGLPTNRGLKPKCLQSLLEMLAYKAYDYHIVVSTKGYNTAENRNYIAAQAVREECTHLFLVDDDMIYAPDTLEKLVASMKPIIGAKYHVRRDVEEGNPDVIEYLNDEDKDRTDIFDCKAIAGGCLLISTEVLKNVPQPHFWYKIFPNGMVEMSNDWWFCEKAREAGYEIWCDGSLYPGHIGQKTYE